MRRAFPRRASHSVGSRPPVLRGAGQDRQLPGGREPALRRPTPGPDRPAPRWAGACSCRVSGATILPGGKRPGVPAGIAYRSKNALALELIDEALARGLPPAPVLADSDYGDDYRWRAALRERQRELLRGGRTESAKAWTSAPVGSPPPAAGRPAPKDLLPAPRRLDQIARELPARAWRKLSWREGTRGPMRGRFARVPIWASHGYTQRQHEGAHPRVAASSSGHPTKTPHRLLAGAPGQPARRRPRSSDSWAWRGNAGAWSRTTVNSRTNSGSTTSRAARGPAGTTTSP